ncbi:MAG: glycosyltransferase [Chitinophagaceae bacterium]|nr:glycosyltransferase [Chitinophagaceae bacterium]
MENEINTPSDPIPVSIIIATYNSGKHLEGCLQSIADQKLKNIEVVIVDGGSTDNTIAIIQSFGQLNISWKSESDNGIYDALNKGIKRAKGKWLHFLGSDDRLLPGFSDLAEKLTDEKTIYYGNSIPHFNEGQKIFELLSGGFSNYRLAKYCINHQTIFYPAAVFKKYSYNLRYKVFADYDLNIKAWGDKEFLKKHYPITVTLYNMSGFSTVANDDLFKKEKPALVRKSFGWIIYLKYMLKKLKKTIRNEDNFF